jgi:antitoxin HicB
MSDNLRYATQIFFSDEDAGFIALAPDLPGCSAFGETGEEALHELQDAIKAWIGAAQKAGNPIPPPSPHRPEELPSGRILARLPKTLHAQLIERAARDNTSLNTCLVMVITKGLAEDPRIDHDFFGGLVQRAVAVGTSGVPTRFLSSWIEAVGQGHFPAFSLEASRSTSAIERVEGIVRGGSALNIFKLPAGKPVIYSDDENG